MVVNAEIPDGRVEMRHPDGRAMTWTECLGPFDPEAYVLVGCIVKDDGPHKFTLLWTFRNRTDAPIAFEEWKNGN